MSWYSDFKCYNKKRITNTRDMCPLYSVRYSVSTYHKLQTGKQAQKHKDSKCKFM